MFFTKVEIPKSEFHIGYENRILTMGSCFAENIGKRLFTACFETEVNPFGVLYNPASIQKSIENLLNNKQFSTTDLFEYKSLWNSFSHSNLFSNPSPEHCLNNINSRASTAIEFLSKTDFLLITFGTAWIYEEISTGDIVCNCHKLPAKQFNRRCLSVTEITDSYAKLIQKLATTYPNLKLIFTVSPVRHWKDGAHYNNLSKSTLLLSIEELQKQFSHVYYFPAYEIQMDELRDYRFFASDMLHPSADAIEYIWQRFSEIYFNDETLKLKKRLEQYISDLGHRPIHPHSAEFELFKNSTHKKRNQLLAEFPFLATRLPKQDSSTLAETLNNLNILPNKQ